MAALESHTALSYLQWDVSNKQLSESGVLRTIDVLQKYKPSGVFIILPELFKPGGITSIRLFTLLLCEV